MSRTKLVLLGTGTPNILPQRSPSSLAVIVDEQPYIIDCGGGILQRIAQAVHEHALSALAMPNLTRLFLTHLHPDHTTGLPDFIIAPWVLDRDAPLQIYGVQGTVALVEGVLAAYETGIAEHRDGLAPINHPLMVEIKEIAAGWTYRDECVTIHAFAARHGGLNSLSYKIVTPDQTIVISGDTAPTQTMIDQARGCDVLVHEVYSAAQFSGRPTAWQRYHSEVHTSTTELAALAQTIQPGKLVLVHQLYWGASDDDLLAEIRATYDGEVISGHDLMIL